MHEVALPVSAMSHHLSSNYHVHLTYVASSTGQKVHIMHMINFVRPKGHTKYLMKNGWCLVPF